MGLLSAKIRQSPEQKISYLFYGSQGRALGTSAHETKPFLEKGYGNSVEIYRVSQSK